MRLERVVHPNPPGHPLLKALRAGSSPFLRRAYPWGLDLDGVLRAAAHVEGGARSGVIDALESENAALGHPSAARAVAPLRTGARAAIAGQQPGLFGGPLLTFEKAAAAVAVAEACTRAGTPTVAVFWSQSEDHDLVEVNRIDVEREDGVTRTTAPLEDRGARLGDLRVDGASVAFAREVAAQCGAPPDAHPWLAPVEGERFSDWTLRIVVAT
ncbi:MAG TPA: bacillithiol biosynthesis BshC, partial [Planctomycetota bacterium]|nr:bacillithiol biosynthesis BshC [Planctomycetota bacterium]